MDKVRIGQRVIKRVGNIFYRGIVIDEFGDEHSQYGDCGVYWRDTKSAWYEWGSDLRHDPAPYVMDMEL